MVFRSLRRSHGASAPKRELARALRREMTPQERALWEVLRRDALGVRVRRQHVVLGYILDFYIPALRLAVEVDGAVHDPEADAARDRALAEVGVEVMRVTNTAVETSLGAVLHLLTARIGVLANDAVGSTAARGEEGIQPGVGSSSSTTSSTLSCTRPSRRV